MSNLDRDAFVRGRSMHHHIRHLNDIQDLAPHRGEEAYETILEIDKTYDGVNWTYRFHVLEKISVEKVYRLHSSFVPTRRPVSSHPSLKHNVT